tara:strand:+ start:23270 stop:23770 length:501 start_codon:yes stop_codon:yes gene_type:complete
MDILHSLAKKDSHWRQSALKMAGNKNDADNLVQEMYLRMHKYTPKEWNYSYVYLVMWNIFKDKKKYSKTDLVFLEEDTFHYLLENVTIANKSSYSDSDLVVLKEIHKLSKEEKKLLSLNYDLSIGKIANNLQQCRIKTFRDLTRIRKKVLGEDLTGYKNRRLKYKR